MKKMNKKVEITILILSSFFIGCLVGILCLGLAIPQCLKTNKDFVEIVKQTKDAVVSIELMNGSNVEATGTGFVYKKGLNKAYILTNEHVVDGVNVRITNSQGETIDAKVLGQDKKLDIAVLEIDSKYALKTLALGDSKKINVGEEIFVIGSPLSKKYSGTITKGIISGTNRIVPIDLDDQEETLFEGIQFDAAVNPGNSGGPLLNMDGEVIGICTMKFIRTEIEGMGFAIPINQAKKVIDDLEQGKEIIRPELGIAMTEVSNTAEINNHNLKIDNDKYQTGIVVLSVKEKSSAYKKLKKGDIITQVDETPISETDDLKKILLTHQKGDTIQVKIIRNDKSKTIKVELK